MMDVEDPRAIFPELWTGHIEKLRDTLNFADQGTIDQSGSWTDVQTIFNEHSAILPKVPRFVNDLARRADFFSSRCKDVQVLDYLEAETCFEMQFLFVEFFTSAISHLHAEHNNIGAYSHSEHREDGESPFALLIEQFFKTTENEIEQTLEWIKNPSPAVLPLDVQVPSTDNDKLRCHVLSDAKTPRRFDRVDYFEKLDAILKPMGEQTSFISVALRGMEGVGKTALASTYIEEKYRNNSYDVVLWVRSEKQAYLQQSFTQIALKLKLPGAQPQTHDENLSLVQEWFQKTKSKWLVVYDHVESEKELRPYWPSTTKGSAIITTSNHSRAFNLTSDNLDVSHWTDEIGSEFLFFLLKDTVGIDMESQLEKEAALFLSRRLGGHALSILQIAGLIHESGSSIHDFMDIYRENVTQITGRDDFVTLRNRAFRRLDADSRSLLGVMSFLMPDTIPQELFEKGVNRASADGLGFCLQNLLFLQTLTRLINPYLVQRNQSTRALSIHRVTQTQFKNSLTKEQLQKSFDRAVALLYNVIPKQDVWKGQLYGEWETYNRYLQHVSYLKDCFKELNIVGQRLEATLEFCKLLIQCQRYLYEVNALTELESFFEVSLVAVKTLQKGPEKDGLQADIMSYQANRAESLGDAEKAISLNEKVLLIRKHIQKELVGHVTNNIGYCYNTANNHVASLEWFKQSYEWWEGNKKQVPSFVRTNMARCMVYLGKFVDAKKELDIAIAQLQRAKDWAMLALAYFVQGTMERRQRSYESAEASFREAGSSWMKGKGRLHPLHGACLYRIGVCCLDQDKVQEAIESFHKSIEVTSFHKESMPVEHARSVFKLSEALSKDSCNKDLPEAEKRWHEAGTYLQKKIPSVSDWNTEDAYDKLIPIFWR